MPRIQAPTVAEHRAAQRVALLDAARSLLAEDSSAPAPSLAAVAKRAGLARSSVYSYFASREDLLHDLIADTFPRWSTYVTEQMGRHAGAGQRVLAYVDANLHLVARGDHALVRALSTTGPADALAASGERFHAELRTPLLAALEQVGAADPSRTAELVQGIVYTLSRMIEEGLGERRAKALAHELLEPYLIRSIGKTVSMVKSGSAGS